MRLIFNLFLLGWWLARQRWMAEGLYPQPSISVNPSNVVAVGEHIRISCKMERNPANKTITFVLMKEISGQWHEIYPTITTQSNEAVLHIVGAQKFHGGIYSCIYKISSLQSYFSNLTYIFVREQIHPSPSISVIPSDMVVRGEKVTIQCTNEYDQYAEFSLIKQGASDQLPTKRTQKKMAEFLIPSAQESDGGIYFCDYRLYQSYDRYSKFSNRTYINITDPRVSKPSIHVEREGQQILDANVWIHCQGPENDLTFSLYRSADFITSQRTKPESSLARFPIFGVRLEDAGNYSCRYQLRGKPFMWSGLSDPVQLEVRDPSLTKPSIQIIHEDKDAPEAKISIRCNGTNEDLAFALLKSREQIAYKAAEPEEKAVDFVLHQMRLEEAQSYTCQYHHGSRPFVWSEPSDPLELPWGGQTPPEAFICIRPSGMVALGEVVTIFCSSEEEFHGDFYLTRHENSSDGGKTAGTKQAESNKAAFSLTNLNQSDGGIYSCRSHLPEDHLFSPLSEKDYLNLTDPSLTKPSIQIIHEDKDAPEANVTIQCKGTKEDLAFALLKSREQIAYKAAEPEEKAVDFFFHQMRLEEAQSYTCQYHHGSRPFVWSEPSDLLELPWGGQTPPEAFICIRPSGMVALGEEVTIFCSSVEEFHGYFYLTVHESSSDGGKTAETKQAESNKAAFSLTNLNQSDGGIYSCRSHLPKDHQFSPLSEKVYLNLTDPSLSKPSIQIKNKEEEVPEASISIRCKGTNEDLAFALLKSREQIAYKAAKPKTKAVDFVLHQMRLEEAQSYTCQYHHKSRPFVWSEPSDPLELPWGGVPSPYIWGGIAASLFLLLILLLLLFVWCKKRRKGSVTKEDNPAVSTALTADAGEHLDEVSYAILNHQPQKTQQATNPGKTSELCLYATVAKTTTAKKQ
ncbi:immunoglobulin superfamily member 1-like isoform 2-T2 [Liasis olivaceus]